MSNNKIHRSQSDAVRITPTKAEWSKAWSNTKRDFKSNIIGFIGVAIFFAILAIIAVIWQGSQSNTSGGACYGGAPGASGLPINQTECH